MSGIVAFAGRGPLLQGAMSGIDAFAGPGPLLQGAMSGIVAFAGLGPLLQGEHFGVAVAGIAACDDGVVAGQPGVAGQAVLVGLLDAEMDRAVVAVMLQEHPARDALHETVGTPRHVVPRRPHGVADSFEQFGIDANRCCALLPRQFCRQFIERQQQEHQARECEPYRGVEQHPFVRATQCEESL